MSDGVMYRFVDPITASGPPMLISYGVIKRTPCGVWIEYDAIGVSKKFILTTAHKKFAHETIEGAAYSYLARKRAELRIYTARAARAVEKVEAAINLTSTYKDIQAAPAGCITLI